MSVCGQADDVSISEDLTVPIREHPEPKTTRKAVRVLIVLAYLLSVSLAAILLSVYYIYMWPSPELPAANSSDVVSGTDAHRSDSFMLYDDDDSNFIGRSNTSISESNSTVANTTALPTNATLTTEASSAKPTDIDDFGDATVNNSNYFDETAVSSSTVQDEVT